MNSLNAYNDLRPQTSAMDLAELQKQYAGAPKPPSAPGVVDMTASAHQAFELLSGSLGELVAKVSPLVEPYPEPSCAAGMQDQKCEASAITGLRMLIERINDKTAEIQRLTAALRI